MLILAEFLPTARGIRQIVKWYVPPDCKKRFSLLMSHTSLWLMFKQTGLVFFQLKVLNAWACKCKKENCLFQEFEYKKT